MVHGSALSTAGAGTDLTSIARIRLDGSIVVIHVIELEFPCKPSSEQQTGLKSEMIYGNPLKRTKSAIVQRPAAL